jgi:hypothetical protein
MRAQAATINYQIANAPAWQAGHSYTHTGHFGDRVVAGPALTPGASPSYTSGQALYLLELTTAGTSNASTSNQPTISSCPSTGITDGTGGTAAVWQCLTQLDYISINDAMWDDPVSWAANATTCAVVPRTPSTPIPPPVVQNGCYYGQQILLANGSAWTECAGFNGTFTSGPCGGTFTGTGTTADQCVAASSGPGPSSAGGPGTIVTDGTCVWAKMRGRI